MMAINLCIQLPFGPRGHLPRCGGGKIIVPRCVYIYKLLFVLYLTGEW